MISTITKADASFQDEDYEGLLSHNVPASNSIPAQKNEHNSQNYYADGGGDDYGYDNETKA